MNYLELGLKALASFGVVAEAVAPDVAILFGRWLDERGFTLEMLDKHIADMLAHPTPDPKP